ncbi:HARB1-like protein [Mya arenaria]|uniref:HARB1-like protein n=1 Tax=Mya arenaria TaxID=6604 RepID=A0ABY7FYU8_MYAAR|nr:HARB1-like protein [Mya arenaria]
MADAVAVLVGLRCLAKGAFFSEVADTHGRDDQMSVKRGFYRKCKFPNIVGAVDGTLVPILAPTANEESFVCRKGFHAINCQAVASSDLRFIDIVAKWPGSSHDAGVFDNSVLKDYLEADLEAVLLGDSGYPLRRYLITPILHPSNENEERCLHRSGGVLPFSPGKSCRKHVVLGRKDVKKWKAAPGVTDALERCGMHPGEALRLNT